jgi:hypothetical protein
VLPEPEHTPSISGQKRISSSISVTIAVDFLAPPVPVRLRPSDVLWATMPKAPIDEDGDTRAHEEQISFLPSALDASIDPESESESVYLPP